MANYAIFFSPTGARGLNPLALFVGRLGMKKVCGGHKENKLYL